MHRFPKVSILVVTFSIFFNTSVHCILRPPLPHLPAGQAQTETFTTINEDQSNGGQQGFQQQQPQPPQFPEEAGAGGGNPIGFDATFSQQRPIPIASPSRDLSPPIRGPGSQSQPPPQQSGFVTATNTNFVQEPSQPQSQNPNVISINGETLELLPPVEIPPAFPIDGDQGQQQGQGQGQAFASSSLNPSTGFGSGGGDGSQFNSFSASSNFAPNPGNPSTSTGGGSGGGVAVGGDNGGSGPRDSGQDCLGTCDCPADFNFVCGSNRFLYQNECALNCDKKCHPDVVKVSMANCSRR